jgi:L-iditol 2-dehydrogenase
MADRKMLAWIKEPDKAGLTKVRSGIPKVTDDHVLVKVKATGICGTDFGIYKGSRKVDANLIPGHEFCGEIIETGKNVKGYEIGDMVVPSCVNRCGKCWSCINGFDAQCEKLEEIGIHINGSFAEYVSVPSATLHKVPKDVDVQIAASIEPVAVAYSAVKKADIFMPGANVIVFGPGAIGLYISQLLKIAGANVLLIGADGDDKRLNLAQSYGICTVDNSMEDLDEEIRNVFPKGKVNLIYDATGVAGIVGGMLQYLLPHGQLILAGIYKDRSSINLLEVVRNEISVKVTFCYTLSEFEGAIQLVLDHKINFDGIVEILPLSQLKEGFENAMSKKSLKVILVP